MAEFKFPKQRIGRIVIEKLLGGWGNFDYSSNNTKAVEVGKNQYSKSLGGISMFRPGYYGHISGGEGYTNITDATTKITDLPVAAVLSSNQRAFTLLKNLRLVYFDPIGLSTTGIYDISIHVGHTTPDGSNGDIMVFKDNAATPIEYVIFSWEDNTDGDIGYRKSSDTTVGNDVWASGLAGGAVLVKGVPHILRLGPDNVIYYTNGRYVGQITISADIATAVIDTTRFDLGVGWVATDIQIYQDYLAIVGYKVISNTGEITGFESKLFLWNTYSKNASYVRNIEDLYCSAIKVLNGVLFAFVKGVGGMGGPLIKIKKFDGIKFITVFESAQFGKTNPPDPRSIDIFQNMIHFYNFDRKICVWDGENFHLRSSEVGATSAGFLKALSATNIFVGSESILNYNIGYLDIGLFEYNAILRTGLYSLPYGSKITGIKVYFSYAPTGVATTGQVKIGLFTDYDVASIGGTTDKLNLTITPPVTKMAFYQKLDIDDINSFYLDINFANGSIQAGSIIRKIEVEYAVLDENLT